MAKEPASIRFKNPGAMWGGNAVSRKWGELANVPLNDGTGQGNRIAVFPTFVNGICAQIDLWRGPRYRNKTFAAAIAVWSGGNHVESYIAFVLKRVPGMKRDTVISDAFLNSPMGLAFLKAQAWHEAGKPYPAPDSDFRAAQARVFGGKQSANPASTAKKTGGAIVVGGGAAASAATTNGLSLPVALAIGIGIAVVVYIVWRFSQSKAPAIVPLPPVISPDPDVPGHTSEPPNPEAV
jgi:hypothetical protein